MTPKQMREVVDRLETYGRVDVFDWLEAYGQARYVMGAVKTPPPIKKGDLETRLLMVGIAAAALETDGLEAFR